MDEAQQARLRSETERLRNSLLSAVSHDLRTPLATITGSASALVEGEGTLDPATRRELAQAIEDEADRLNRLVQNLLEMTRLEAGGIRVRKDWQPLEEVVGQRAGPRGEAPRRAPRRHPAGAPTCRWCRSIPCSSSRC